MNEVINGQIVAALEQWEATILIIASLAVAYLLRLLWRVGKSKLTTSERL